MALNRNKPILGRLNKNGKKVFSTKNPQLSSGIWLLIGDTVGIRTPNLRIRSAMLYPVELQCHCC